VLRQLTLDLGTPPPSTFDNFFAGANAELVTRLRELDNALAAGPVADRTFYVWGEAGSGRTHLLQALVHEAPPGHARFASPQSSLAAFASIRASRSTPSTIATPVRRAADRRSSTCSTKCARIPPARWSPRATPRRSA
jgi:predicted ATPase